jgi:hypothetical protein
MPLKVKNQQVVKDRMFPLSNHVTSKKLIRRTRLHMDVADAINVMLYASPRPDGQPGCAVWDLFRAEDADTIREFLKEKYGGKVLFTDPIHSQVFYLDSELRKELEEKHGVVSFRVYQYPVSFLLLLRRVD